MMSEITLLTTSTVIVVLLNGKMIVHKIEFKIEVIILDKGNFMLSNLLVRHWLADHKCNTKNVFFLSKKAVSHMTFVNCPTSQPLSIKAKILHLQWASPPRGLLTISIFLPKERVKVNVQNNPIIHFICKLY